MLHPAARLPAACLVASLSCALIAQPAPRAPGAVPQRSEPVSPSVARRHPGFPARSGIVRAAGRTWADAGGEFYPLGATLFWALRGWKFERARLERNLDFLAREGWDYVRILGEVGWAGNEIDPRWDDYAQVLGEFVDTAYGTYGLRTELTLIGGGTGTRPIDLARKVVPVLAPRTSKIMNLEVANEAFQNYPDEEALFEALRHLRAHLPNLVAVTSPRGTPQATIATMKRYISSGATLATVHLSRPYDAREGAWRHVGLGWSYRGLPFPIAHNEPGGPRSSVAQYDQPIHLVMSRAVGIMSGIGAYVLHNGAGIAGRVDKRRDRPPNLWEVPRIGGIMRALRRLDSHLPAGLGNGRHYSTGAAGHPLPVTGRGAGTEPGHDVIRADAVDLGNRFVVMPIGVKGRLTMTAREACTVEVVDPATGEAFRQTLRAGEALQLVPQSLDPTGLGAFIIVGTRE